MRRAAEEEKVGSCDDAGVVRLLFVGLSNGRVAAGESSTSSSTTLSSFVAVKSPINKIFSGVTEASTVSKQKNKQGKNDILETGHYMSNTTTRFYYRAISGAAIKTHHIQLSEHCSIVDPFAECYSDIRSATVYI